MLFEQKPSFVVPSIVYEPVVYLLKTCNGWLNLIFMDSSLSFMKIGRWGEEGLSYVYLKGIDKM